MLFFMKKKSISLVGFYYLLMIRLWLTFRAKLWLCRAYKLYMYLHLYTFVTLHCFTVHCIYLIAYFSFSIFIENFKDFVRSMIMLVPFSFFLPFSQWLCHF